MSRPFPFRPFVTTAVESQGYEGVRCQRRLASQFFFWFLFFLPLSGSLFVVRLFSRPLCYYRVIVNAVEPTGGPAIRGNRCTVASSGRRLRYPRRQFSSDTATGHHYSFVLTIHSYVRSSCGIPAGRASLSLSFALET